MDQEEIQKYVMVVEIDESLLIGDFGIDYAAAVINEALYNVYDADLITVRPLSEIIAC